MSLFIAFLLYNSYTSVSPTGGVLLGLWTELLPQHASSAQMISRSKLRGFLNTAFLNMHFQTALLGVLSRVKPRPWAKGFGYASD